MPIGGDGHMKSPRSKVGSRVRMVCVQNLSKSFKIQSGHSNAIASGAPVTDWHALGGVCGHNNAYGLSLFPHQRKLCTEGLLGRHALVGMLGRTLLMYLELSRAQNPQCVAGHWLQ